MRNRNVYYYASFYKVYPAFCVMHYFLLKHFMLAEHHVDCKFCIHHMK